MYLNWQLWTLVGLLFGAAFPGLQSLGLDFAMVATFIAIIVPQLVAVRFVAAALAAGVLSFAWQGWPYKLGLLAAVFVGVAVGMVSDGDREPSAHSGAHAMNSLIDNVSSSYVAADPRHGAHHLR